MKKWVVASLLGLAAMVVLLLGNVRVSDSAVPEGGTGEVVYLVIDLSSGASSSSYPVSTLDALPDPIPDEYKSSKLVLRRIPAGHFTMGSPTNEVGRYPDSDETQHSVTLTEDFYIGVFEVTQRQWELVMGNRPSDFNNTTYYKTRPVEQVSYSDVRGASAGAGWPANNAVDATSFVGKLRARTGFTFDLPTESQWEYACRAGTTTALNSGKNLASWGSDANMNEVGRYWHNGGKGYSSNSDASVGTAKVGSYLPNQWGLYDMHGNVAEWCLDWYGTYPGAVSDPAGPTSGPVRVTRGGYWDSSAWLGRSAFRSRCQPSPRARYMGLRLSCAPPPPVQ